MGVFVDIEELAFGRRVFDFEAGNKPDIAFVLFKMFAGAIFMTQVT